MARAGLALSLATTLPLLLTSHAPAMASREEARSTATSPALPTPERQSTGGALTQSMASLLWDLTVALDLSATVAVRIFPIVSEFHQAAQRLERERNDIARDLRAQLSSARPDPATLQVLAACLQANHALQSGLAEDQFSALRKFLTPVQQAKYLLLAPRLTYLHRHEAQ